MANSALQTNEGQQSPIESATTSLTREVNLLHEILDSLEQRLSPLLAPPEVAAGKAASDRGNNANLTPVAHRISERVRTSVAGIERARERVSHLINSLEV